MKVIVTGPARKRLREIYEYYRKKANRHVANNIRKNILHSMKIISTFPQAGQVEPYLEYLQLEHHRIVSGNYKIIYRIIKNKVYVTDIFDARQDPSKMKT